MLQTISWQLSSIPKYCSPYSAIYIHPCQSLLSRTVHNDLLLLYIPVKIFDPPPPSSDTWSDTVSDTNSDTDSSAFDI